MKFKKCGFENPKDAVFCEECGEKLKFLCPGCGYGNRTGAKFCKKCGAKLVRKKINTIKPPSPTGGIKSYVC